MFATPTRWEVYCGLSIKRIVNESIESSDSSSRLLSAMVRPRRFPSSSMTAMTFWKKQAIHYQIIKHSKKTVRSYHHHADNSYIILCTYRNSPPEADVLPIQYPTHLHIETFSIVNHIPPNVASSDASRDNHQGRETFHVPHV